MITIIIPLKHIILDPAKPVDLSTLSEQDAADLIKQSYGFLSPAIEVSIQDGIATIGLQEQRADKISEALKIFQKGVREAQQGSYQKAIKYFSKVIETIPQHVDARRNLAMAHLETGNIPLAKELLQQCIKIDPTNVWSFVLLGNIATKHERAFEVAAFYYEKGLSINPDDNILINNFAALSMEMGNIDQARALFEKALKIDAGYPNTYFGLALLYRVTNLPEKALETLEQLFKQPSSEDIRSAPVYKNARGLYLEICTELARKESGALMHGMIMRKTKLERATGHPIKIEEDNSLEYISAVSQMAWKHNRDEHRIRYRMRSEAMTPHLVAHELEHIVLEHEARQIARNKFFTTTARTREYAIGSVADHIAKLQRQGYAEDSITNTILKLTSGLSNQIFNCPLDMVVETNIYNKYPELRHSQFASLHQMHLEALQTFTNQEIKQLTPPIIFRASVTLNCAYALFIDDLFSGLTDYAVAYRKSEYFPHGQNLFDIWKTSMARHTPGDEYDVVDEFARILKIRPWYDWQTDTTCPNVNQESAEPALSEPLKTDKPEAYTFCLDALRRFEGQSRDSIFPVISEISLLGMNGIDHTTPGKTYTIKAYPDETFSGLHLLCLMYVGFKLYDPSVNCGLDFAEAYEMALEAHKASIH